MAGIFNTGVRLLCLIILSASLTAFVPRGIPPYTCPGVDSPPAPASANGLTCESFVTNFTSESGIDANNTGNPGYQWYTNISWTSGTISGAGPTPSSDYSIVAGGLELNPQSNTPYNVAGGNAMLNTCGTTDTVGGHVGQAFKPPFYLDVTVEEPNGRDGSSNRPFGAIWMFPLQTFSNGTTKGTNAIEIDLNEDPFGYTLHNWYYTGSTTEYSTSSGNNSVGVTQTIAGQLVIPTTLNSGTGLIYPYNNDVNTSANNCSYTTTSTPTCGGGVTPLTGGSPNGMFSGLDNESECLMLSAGIGYPVVIRKVAVWQLPPP